jgi:hypothetical protein
MDMGGPRRRCLRGLRGALRGILLRLAVAFLGQVGMPFKRGSGLAQSRTWPGFRLTPAEHSA